MNKNEIETARRAILKELGLKDENEGPHVKDNVVPTSLYPMPSHIYYPVGDRYYAALQGGFYSEGANIVSSLFALIPDEATEKSEQLMHDFVSIAEGAIRDAFLAQIAKKGR